MSVFPVGVAAETTLSSKVRKLEKASLVAFTPRPESNNAFTPEHTLFCLEKSGNREGWLWFPKPVLGKFTGFSIPSYSLDFVGEQNLAARNGSLA